MRTPNGFSIIEALVALTVLSILIGIAVPSFAQLLQAQQLDSATQAMLRSLAIARHEAIKRGQPLGMV